MNRIPPGLMDWASRMRSMTERVAAASSPSSGGGGQPPPLAVLAPSGPAAPEVPLAMPTDSISATREQFTRGFDWRTPSREISLATTVGEWTSLDVHAQTSIPVPVGTTGTLSIFVYAVTGGIRSLVGSGRITVSGFGAGTNQVRPPRWLVAARHLATRFEVTALWQQPSALVFPGSVQVSIIASNDGAPAPSWVGAELLNRLNMSADLTQVGVAAAGTIFVDRPEVIAVRASNGSAAARWLHLFDVPADPVNGDTPMLVWPLGAQGQGVVDTDFTYRQTLGKIAFLASSTPLVLTKAVDCAISVMAR